MAGESGRASSLRPLDPNRLRLYVVTDRALARGRSEVEVVRAALEGGATAIQLRGRDWRSRELYRVGRERGQLTREAGALCVGNERVDMARAVGADAGDLWQEG